jgi:deazaflavin-dependent oxidoreductase (nitroreductase family)
MRFVRRLLFVVAAVGAVFVVGMRTKTPIVVNTVRRLGRATRPLALKTAGTERTATSVIRHVGRTSGRTYDTPVVTAATDDGFVIALPYGPNTDWVKNVLARGSAFIVDRGTIYAVERPEVIPLAEVERYFSPTDQRAHRVFGVTEVLRLHSAQV